MATQKRIYSPSATSIEEDRYAGMDERKRKRMISNRDSARRSRMKKQKLIEDLTTEIARIRSENDGILGRISELLEGHRAFEGENRVLRALVEGLRERYKSLVGLAEVEGV